MQKLKVVFVIIGALIGAGFASGQEIYTFFFSFGLKGLLGIIVSSSIIGIAIYKILKITIKNNINNYKQFLDQFIEQERIKEIINSIINIFILLSFYIMIAGFGAYLEQEYEIKSIIGSSVLSIICYILLKRNTDGIVKVNQILIPILIVIVVLIGIINFKNIDVKNISYYITEQNANNWLITSMLYASYNIVLLAPVLITMKEYLKKSNDIKYIALISTAIITILIITVYLFLVNIDIEINKLEMPAVYAINKIVPEVKGGYGGIILISIFTTAISLGISFIKNTSNNKKQFNKMALLICTTSVVFSQIGFANLINFLYPILGGLGLIQIAFLIFKKRLRFLKEKLSKGT